MSFFKMCAYLYKGYSYDFILDMMSTLHDIYMSGQTLNGWLKDAELFVRKYYSSQ